MIKPHILFSAIQYQTSVLQLCFFSKNIKKSPNEGNLAEIQSPHGSLFHAGVPTKHPPTVQIHNHADIQTGWLEDINITTTSERSMSSYGY